MSGKGLLNLNVDEQKCLQRCMEKSCRCSSGFKFSDNTILSSPAENPQWNSLCVLQSKTCTTAPFLHIPLNLRSSEFIFEISKHQKTRSVNDLSEIIFDYFMAPGLQNEALNPPGKMMYDSLEKFLKAEVLLNRILFSDMSSLDANVNQFTLTSTHTKYLKSTELNPSLHGSSTSLKKLNVELDAVGKQVSGLKISECSHQLTEFLHSSVSKGLLCRVCKDGMPYFVFTMDDNWGEVFVASPHKIESMTDEALDYVFLFHARKCQKKGNKISVDNSQKFVAKMNVSSSLVPNSCSSEVMETEFILFSASEDRPMGPEISSSASIKGKSLSKKVARILKPNHSFNMPKPTYKIGKPSFQYDELLHQPFLCELCNFVGLDSNKYLYSDFPPNLELAAIVMKGLQCTTKSEPEVGGWGLKFLQKATLARSFSPEICEESCVKTTTQTNKIVNVIVPAGFHGGPNTRIGGPSSLTERWRSDGHCECGGWDLGCPLTVLRHVPICAKSSPGEQPQEDSKSVYFFKEGAENGEPMIKMVDVDEGRHHIYFQSTLSALQCFSIGVAMIHSQTLSSLNPKL
ncbi:hypothetical protein J5N97_023298 [Dioscorea zingiberensis]|uniref:Uncharacterized protein n=1 Tax=Dioscorea zingiberensis TaxID=325984 RepID=A0A9D5CC56_9LILI|nr:hypothetical protein J5N97_023298 [Dioscorea zingiberensis]